MGHQDEPNEEFLLGSCLDPGMAYIILCSVFIIIVVIFLMMIDEGTRELTRPNQGAFMPAFHKPHCCSSGRDINRGLSNIFSKYLETPQKPPGEYQQHAFKNMFKSGTPGIFRNFSPQVTKHLCTMCVMKRFTKGFSNP